MKLLFALSLLLLMVSTALLADLRCTDVNVKWNSQGTSCSSCNQWAFGQVDKDGDDAGLLCLYLCSTHSYNVCEPTLTLWVGTDWGNHCYYVEREDSTVDWVLESNRDDWFDEVGAVAEIFMYLPCYSCRPKHATLLWNEDCYYCEGCGN
jgi:hypothetical protein